MNTSWKRWSVRPVVRAAALALVAMGGAQAGPTQPNWTMDVLATWGVSSVAGIDASGRIGGTNANNQVLRWSLNGQATVMGSGIALGMGRDGSMVGADASFTEARLWTDSGNVVLPNLGGSSAYAVAINDHLDVVGGANDWDYNMAAVLWRNRKAVPIGIPGSARGINTHGSIVGIDEAQSPRAFVVDSAGYRVLPAPYNAIASFGLAINDSGWVAGMSTTTTRAGVAWVYDGQELREIATSGGYTRPAAINNSGQVVGFQYLLPDYSASIGFLHAAGRFHDLNTLPGVGGRSFAVALAAGINELGQIAVGLDFGAGADAGAGRLTLTTNVWSNPDSGSWADATNWAYGTAPNRLAHVVIDPTRATVVFGPESRAEVAGLTVGTDNAGGGGVATLALRGGTIATVGERVGGPFGFTGVWVGQNGVLTGDGTIRIESAMPGELRNYGTVIADNVRIQGSTPTNATLRNHGLIVGSGVGTPRLVAGMVENMRDGRIRVLRGERLTLEGGLVNLGSIEVLGGQFTHFGSGGVNLRSDAAQGAVGRMAVQDGLLTMSTGLVVDGGQFLVSGGNLNNVFGRVVVQRGTADGRGGQVILSGSSQTSFYDPVDVNAGAELRVSNGSTAVFFGQVFQRSGALFTGSGRKFYEGGLAIGNSPGIGRDEGDVDFGAGNVYEAEIGGSVPGSGHDQYIVGGHLTFGGTLKLVSWAGFVGHVGERFDLFDWGTASGQFDAIDAGSFVLAAGTVLDTSRLYLDGTVAVQAVPEPASWALMLGGVIGVWALRRRRAGTP